jgi:hyperosmotically inducible protein
MTRSVSAGLALAALAIALGATGCEKKGPAEKAGEKIDHAVATAGSAVKDTGDKMKDAVDQ